MEEGPRAMRALTPTSLRSVAPLPISGEGHGKGLPPLLTSGEGAAAGRGRGPLLSAFGLTTNSIRTSFISETLLLHQLDEVGLRREVFLLVEDLVTCADERERLRDEGSLDAVVRTRQR